MEEKDIIGGRLHNSFFEDSFENTSYEIGDDLITSFGKPINVYKFRRVSGITRITNFGEKSVSYSNNKFQQTTNVYNGKSPINVVWEGSTKLVVNEQDKIIKETKVGTYYKLYFHEATNTQLVVDNINILNKEYVNSYLNKEITLHSIDWNPTDDDILDYVYLILDKRNQSYQWLEISSVQPYYHENTKKFVRSEISFENINLKYSRTGKTLVDLIQFGAIGEGYCFPKEDEDGNVTLDEERLLRPRDGAIELQFDFNGGTGNSSFLIWGRRKEQQVDGKIILDKTHLLLPYRINYPQLGDFFYNQPNLNSYVIINAKPNKQEIWNSYKTSYKNNERIGEYNVDKTKQVLTGFSVNSNEVRQTNPGVSTYVNWDNLYNINLDFDVNLEPIPFLNKEVKKIERKVDYSTFFTINAFLNWTSDVFNYDYRETIKYKLTDTLGILGSLVNILVGGLDIGWTRDRNYTDLKQQINFLCPCISFEDGKAALTEQAPLPTDIFIDDNAKKILPTATNVLTSWNMSLTDMFQDETLEVENAEIGKGGKGIWYTKYLGQAKDEDGNWLLSTKQTVKLNLQTFRPYVRKEEVTSYIIDFVDFKAVGQCDYRISSYNTRNEVIYSSYQETNAKARDEISLWGNQIKFNCYDQFNTEGQAQWPENVVTPKPDIDKYKYIIKETNDLNIFENAVLKKDNKKFNLFDPFFEQQFTGTIQTNARTVVDKVDITGPTYRTEATRVYQPAENKENVYWKEELNQDIEFIVKEPILINIQDDIDITNFKDVEIEFWDGTKTTHPTSEEIKLISFEPKNTDLTRILEENVFVATTNWGNRYVLNTTTQNKVLEVLYEGVYISFVLHLNNKQLLINEIKFSTSKITLIEKQKAGLSSFISPLKEVVNIKSGTLSKPLQNFIIKQISLIPKLT